MLTNELCSTITKFGLQFEIVSLITAFNLKQPLSCYTFSIGGSHYRYTNEILVKKILNKGLSTIHCIKYRRFKVIKHIMAVEISKVLFNDELEYFDVFDVRCLRHVAIRK